jgi:phosphatidate phosphatase LPIN
MKLGSSGEAFFVNEADKEVPEDMATSPLPVRSEKIAPPTRVASPLGGNAGEAVVDPEEEVDNAELAAAAAVAVAGGGAGEGGEDGDGGAASETPEKKTAWQWGGLPRQGSLGSDGNASSGMSTPNSEASVGDDADELSKSWMGRISQIFSSSEGGAMQEVPGGVYLKDLTTEQAAAYLGKASMSNTSMSTSKPVQPTSSSSSVDDQTQPDVAMSLCGLNNLAEFRSHRVTWARFQEKPMLMSDPDLVVWIRGRVYSWAVAGPIIMALVVFGQPLEDDDIDRIIANHIGGGGGSEGEKTGSSWWFFGRPSKGSAEGRRSRMNSGSSMTLPTSRPGSPTTSAGADSGVASEAGPFAYSKALVLGTEELQELKLKPGENHAKFTVTTKMQGTATVECAVYLWKHDAKVVISDVDGTITRSDLLGHAANVLGRDWTHEGVASLYSAIEKNGYTMMYLTSRSISHAPLTREYMQGVAQDSGVKLPRGPILFSPQNFFTSIHREVIARNPQEFKVACLSSIVSLFPTRTLGPFTAGFGNRHTDEISYRAVHIPHDRIFTIDPKGNVKIGAPTPAAGDAKGKGGGHGHGAGPVASNSGGGAAGGSVDEKKVASISSSYPKMQSFCDLYFPPVVAESGKGLVEARDFSSVKYWGSGSYVPEGLDIDAMLND